MTGFRLSALLIAAIAASVIAPSRAPAQWWKSAPADFEECADLAEKVPAKDARTAALAQCNAKFAGRRKPGGGYSYYDFMQNRSFDIAGPNPTPQEQKHIDLQYTVFLDRERQSSIAAAFAQQQQHQQELQQASLANEQASLPATPPSKPRPAATDVRPHAKTAACKKGSFSCDWPRLSESINELKKALFGAPPGKANRS